MQPIMIGPPIHPSTCAPPADRPTDSLAEYYAHSSPLSPGLAQISVCTGMYVCVCTRVRVCMRVWCVCGVCLMYVWCVWVSGWVCRPVCRCFSHAVHGFKNDIASDGFI